MKTLNAAEMRQAEGGWWGFFVWNIAAYAGVYARALYEHNVYGRHITNYSWCCSKCPICGKNW